MGKWYNRKNVLILFCRFVGILSSTRVSLLHGAEVYVSILIHSCNPVVSDNVLQWCQHKLNQKRTLENHEKILFDKQATFNVYYKMWEKSGRFIYLCYVCIVYCTCHYLGKYIKTIWRIIMAWKSEIHNK